MADVRLERQLRYYFSDKNLWKDDARHGLLGASTEPFEAFFGAVRSWFEAPTALKQP